MKKQLLISSCLTLCLLTGQFSFAQNVTVQQPGPSGKIRCSSTEYLETQLKNDPGLAARIEKNENDRL